MLNIYQLDKFGNFTVCLDLKFLVFWFFSIFQIYGNLTIATGDTVYFFKENYSQTFE